MFVKRRSTNAIPPPKKKRKTASPIEEITFDLSAREDYLTGFHKRKLQRIKQAKEEAAKKEREEKLAARKILREGRKADLEKHVEEVNSLLRKADEGFSDSDDENPAGHPEKWDGIQEEPAIDHEAEYVDEDRFTTVTVEAVDVTRDGLHKAAGEFDGDQDLPSVEKSTERSPGDAALQKEQRRPKRKWTMEAQKGPKKKKKAFRYESKAERKVTRYKERSGSRAKAKNRKE